MPRINNHYTTLGIPKNADEGEIKKAYRKLAREVHPDRPGGDAEEFKKISEAYEVLSDPKTKSDYDNPLASMFMNFTSSSEPSFFTNLFEGMQGGIPFATQNYAQPPKKKSNANMVHKVTLTLEDFYTGKNCKFAISRKETCKDCGGQGGWGKKEVECIGCNGQGVRVSQRGYNSVSRSACIKCRGKKTSLMFEKVCRACKTLGITPQRVVVKAKFEPGSLPGDKVILKGMGDCTGGIPPGDVIVTAAEKSHRIFKRKLKTLRCSIDITLRQSLCGFSEIITHLDGRSLEIKSDPHKITPHGHKFVVKGEGIPRGEGCLEITTNVIFPNAVVPKDVAARLEECLDVLEKQ